MTSYIITFVELLLQAFSFAILARVILSWINPTGQGRIAEIIYEATEPILAPIRRIIPPIGGMLDLSPIVAMLLLQFLGTALISSLGA